MALKSADMLNAPIPGMSLTTEPGDRPWENPPEMATVEEALEFYASRILKKKNHDDLLDALELGIPVRNIANIMQTSAVMEGRHNLDVGFLVAPAIEELIMAVADVHNVKYIRSAEEFVTENSVTTRQARLAVQEAMKEMDMRNAEPDAEEEMPEAPRGLMAKRKEVAEE